MKKLFFSFLMLSLVATTFTSCSKDKDDNQTTQPPVSNLGENTWKAGGTLHAGVGAILLDTLGAHGLVSTDTSGNLVAIVFKEVPTQSGNYDLAPLTSIQSLSDNQSIVVYFDKVNSETYNSTSENTEKVHVTIENGKVKGIVPATTLKNINPLKNTTVTFEAVLKES